jgi:hypothetical protein
MQTDTPCRMPRGVQALSYSRVARRQDRFSISVDQRITFSIWPQQFRMKCGTDLTMTGGPFTPNDENRPLVPQHRTANERERSVALDLTLDGAALCARRSLAALLRSRFCASGGAPGVGSVDYRKCETGLNDSTQSRCQPLERYIRGRARGAAWKRKRDISHAGDRRTALCPL